MTTKQRKDAPHHDIRELQLKQSRDTITHLPERPTSTKPTPPDADKDAEQQAPSGTAGGNAEQHSRFEGRLAASQEAPVLPHDPGTMLLGTHPDDRKTQRPHKPAHKRLAELHS